jgi:hypothetical protein
LPTKDYVLQYPSKVEPPLFAQSFQPDAGFPWPQPVSLPVQRPKRIIPQFGTFDLTASTEPVFPWPRQEVPVLRPKRVIPLDTSIDFSVANAPPAFDPTEFPWSQPFEVTRPKTRPSHWFSVGDRAVPLSLESGTTIDWWHQPSEPRWTRKQTLREHMSPFIDIADIPSAPQDIEWWRQPSEPVRQPRRIVREGWSVPSWAVPLTFEFGTTIDWWRQPSEPKRFKAPKPWELASPFIDTEDLPTGPAGIEWYRQPVPPIILRRQPVVAVGFVSRGIPTDQFLGEPYIAWYRQPVEQPSVDRRPLVNTGWSVRGVPTDLFLGSPYVDWYRQPVERPRVGRRPIVNVGVVVLGNEVYVPITEKALSWWRQPSERLHRVKGLGVALQRFHWWNLLAITPVDLIPTDFPQDGTIVGTGQPSLSGGSGSVTQLPGEGSSTRRTRGG